jgi:hypothetical protein
MRYKILIISFIISSISLSTNQGYGQNLSNKVIPTEVLIEVQKALSFYPELDDYKIEFEFKRKMKNCVMQAQPKVKTFFSKKENRQYKILMSRNLIMNDTSMVLEQLPSEILVGWFAHELGHIMDYKERTSFNMIGFGFKYLTSRPFLKRSERKADALAVKHGMGGHLIKTKRYILFNSKFTKEYKAKIKDLYPSPEDILAWAED